MAPALSSNPKKSSDDYAQQRLPKKLRVLALMQADRVPPPDAEELGESDYNQFRTDHNVISGLRGLGHEVIQLGVGDELTQVREILDEQQPDVVFNLVDAFRGLPANDTHVVHYLEVMRAAYTGCNPRGLILARDKALSKKVLHFHETPTPRFTVVRPGRKVRRPRPLCFPLIVKPLTYEGSTGIAQASVVHDDDALAKRVAYVHEALECAAIVEQFIPGREVYVGVLGNHRVQVLPTWELYLDGMPAQQAKIATYSAKWDLAYQKKHQIELGPAGDIPPSVQRRLQAISRRIYRALGLSGYARLDFRLREDGTFFLLEANPNPDVARADEFAMAARAAGIAYEPLLQRLLRLGINWHKQHYV